MNKPIAAPKPPPAVPSAAASARRAEVGLLLLEAYDHAGRRYKPGWSDERIAKQLDLSLTFVARRREEDFGPLAIETEVAAIAREIEALVKTLAGTSLTLSTMREALTVAGQQIDKLERWRALLAEKLEAARARLAKVGAATP